MTVAIFRTRMCPKPKEYAPSTAKPCDGCHFKSTDLPKRKQNTRSKRVCQKSGSGKENRNVGNLVKASSFLSSSTFNVTIFCSGSAFLAIYKGPPSCRNLQTCEGCFGFAARALKCTSAALILLRDSKRAKDALALLPELQKPRLLL